MRKELVLRTQSSSATCPIVVGPGVLSELSRYTAGTKFACVVDSSVYELHGELILGTLQLSEDAVFRVEGGEKAKGLETAAELWNFFVRLGLNRSSLVVNIGGGLVLDVGGFAASTFMRGVPFVQVPTTLLAQVDASVGGKTGINFAKSKNTIGTTTQPRAVLIDTRFLSTLPEREFRSGLAEVLKHGFIADRAYAEKAAHLTSPPDPEKITEVVARSCEIKKSIVESDERETGPRKLLNFGHTFGHAIEAWVLEYGTPLSHGEAIAIGMIAESHISYRSGYISGEQLETVKLTIERAGLPTRLPSTIPFDALLALMRRDKKNSGGEIQWTLLEQIGQGIYDIVVSDELIEEAYTYLYAGV